MSRRHRAAPPSSAAEQMEITPIWISSRARNLIAAAAILVLLVAIWRVPDILTIVLGASTLALILSFPVRWLSHVVPRGPAVLVTLLLMVGLLGLIFTVLVPLLIAQLTELITALPGIQNRLDRLLDAAIQELQARGLIAEQGEGQANRLRQAVSARIQELAGSLLGWLLNLASGAFSFAVQLIAIVTVAIYLLLDINKVRDTFIGLAPPQYSRDAAALWAEFGDSISRYLAGVVLIAVITGVVSGVALWLIGVPYALLLALWVGFTSFIPVFGTYLGVVPAIPLALAESPMTALLTVLAYVIIQNIQDNVLTPRVQGETTHVHPILVLLTVLWTGLAFGLGWSVLAVPALVVIRVLVDFFRERIHVRREWHPVQAVASAGGVERSPALTTRGRDEDPRG